MKKGIIILTLILFASIFVFTQKIEEKGFCKHFVGTINKNLKIRMILTTANEEINNGKKQTSILGSYFYENQGEELYLKGTFDEKSGKIDLDENDRYEAETGNFKLNIDKNKITGTWKSKTDKKNYDVSLVEDYTSSVEFKAYYTENKYYYNNDKSYKPYEIFFLYNYPGKFSNKTVLEKIQNKLLRLILGLTSEKSNPSENLNTFIQNKINTYNQEAKDFEKDQEKIDKTLPFYNWQLYGFSLPFFNDYNILTVESTSYEYSGGAHGGSLLNFYVFDLKTGEQITLKQIFKDNYDKKLNELVVNKLDIYSQKTKGSKLKDVVFDMDKVQSNDNFYITKGGIGFFYNQYEIAAYAVGQFEVFIPFSELKEILKEKSPISQLFSIK